MFRVESRQDATNLLSSVVRIRNRSLTRIVDIGHGPFAVSVEQSAVCHISLNKFLPIVHAISSCGEDVKEYFACAAATACFDARLLQSLLKLAELCWAVKRFYI